MTTHRSVHYDFEALTEGVTFARARPGGGALSNSALVDLGPDLVVFDTSLTPVAAEELVRAGIAATGRAPTLAANSHWHLDHILGNQVFAPLPRFATVRTLGVLHERKESLAAEISAETLRREVQELEKKIRQASSPDVRAYLQEVLDVNRWVLRATPDLRITPPNRTFEGRLALPGTRRAELLSFGSGHTESDALLHLPEERLVCSGDLVVVGTHPNLTSGDPEHWLEVLDQIDRLRPERIVPGHGPVGNRESLGAMRDYLEMILSLPLGAGEVPEVPARFRGWTEPGQFEENVRFLRRRGSQGTGRR